jgi:hypothetical protein
MRTPAFYALAMLLAAAAIAAAETEPTTMTSNYRQPIYDIPYSGVVPSGVSNALDDDFSATRPELVIDGTTVPGYVATDAKWRLYDPSGNEPFFGIDPRVQMCLLSADPTKAWVGLYQQLPAEFLPSSIGETKDVTVYTRATLAFIEGSADLFDALRFGLLVGDDLLAAPTTSQLITVGPRVTRAADPDDDVVTLAGAVESCEFLTFDGIAIPTGRLGNGWPAASFLRLRLSQTKNGEGDFSYSYGADAGSNGNDWAEIFADEITGATGPLKSVGFGLNSNGTGIAAYIDLFRVLDQPLGDLTRTIGGVQQLGAV